MRDEECRTANRHAEPIYGGIEELMKRKQPPLIDLRKEYHLKICRKILGYRSGSKVYTIADGSSKTSIDLSARMVAKLCVEPCRSPATGQTAGTLFTTYTMEFLDSAFEALHHLRPGKWYFSTSQAGPGIARFDQYQHLADLQKVIATNKELKAALGGDYLVTPDIIVARQPEPDETINANGLLVSASTETGRYSPLRANNTSLASLHASISCKWTMRSDRAQNTRTEALNLIRNRKGKTPHIVAVTMEPMPTRLASIAMGTGDIDCVYHAALYELQEAASESGKEDQAEVLETLVEGRRLRDISDLAFDLCI
jgi:hypothetical protein